jgi:transcription antitermination factor NusG
VDDNVVALCKNRADKQGYVTLNCNIDPGDWVVVTAGPLKGLAGVFERELPEYERVRILITAISYQARVEVHTGDIRKCPPQIAA